jgi:1-deoxy-D-xylulose-5-phosphate reductoisomerase
MIGVAVLGSTGSIGRSTLAVLGRHRDRFRVVALAANRNRGLLEAQAARYGPDLTVLVNGAGVEDSGWAGGVEGLVAAASHPEADIVVNAVVGAAGLPATIAALRAGKRLALANKESLVAGGPLVLDALREGGGELIPVDSEHSAILQCLPGGSPANVRRMILTASGGAFRSRTRQELETVTAQDALRHPTWDMGPKITVDSATLANKALEVVEAHFLFALPYDRLEAVVHPQSIIHSMVEFQDGSVLSQMGFPTMELPILYALTHPDRFTDGVRPFDPVAAGPLTFEPVDHERFPTFGLGVAAGRAGGTAPAVFNAANEMAVEAFLEGTIRFMGIPRVIERTMAACGTRPIQALDDVNGADREARDRARAIIEELK